ncbi:hypothetical protein B484DRAFT_436458 [Ochromonadaceae sp. CCMP2298]|nr:hypothetical protein B484DRAFT_436458 [Ochromonadaceae sp. CCMP2298]
MTNFIDLYTRIVEDMKADADKMVAGGKLLTTYASLVYRRNLNEAQHYNVRHLEKHKYEVKRKGQLMRKPQLAYLVADNTLRPCDGTRSTRGPLAKKRKEGLSKRGFAPLDSASVSPWSQLSKSTKNVNENSLEAALEQEAEKPEPFLRGRVAAAANSLFEFFGGDAKLDNQDA